MKYITFEELSSSAELSFKKIGRKVFENEDLLDSCRRLILEETLRLNSPEMPPQLTSADFPLPEILEYAKSCGRVFSADRLKIQGCGEISQEIFDCCLAALHVDGLGYCHRLKEYPDNPLELEELVFFPVQN